MNKRRKEGKKKRRKEEKIKSERAKMKSGR
jgi:hypothetical protein